MGVAPASVHTDYIEEVRGRIQETGATERDFMLPEDAMTFFGTLADVRRALPSAKSLILLGVYAFDGDDDYKASRRELRGKTAKIYNYYPVVRQIAEQLAAFIEEAGYQAIQGQQIPLKHAAHEMGLGAYGWNGVLQTRDFGSYVALRAVATDAELEPDAFERHAAPCEDCGRCLKACPTGALYAPYKSARQTSASSRACGTPARGLIRPIMPATGTSGARHDARISRVCWRTTAPA